MIVEGDMGGGSSSAMTIQYLGVATGSNYGTKSFTYTGSDKGSLTIDNFLIVPQYSSSNYKQTSTYSVATTGEVLKAEVSITNGAPTYNSSTGVLSIPGIYYEDLRLFSSGMLKQSISNVGYHTLDIYLIK